MTTGKYLIERYSVDTVGFHKYDLPVVPAAHDYSRFHPFSAVRGALINKVKSILDADSGDAEAQYQQYMNGGGTDGNPNYGENDVGSLPEIFRIHKLYPRYSNTTLRAFINTFGKGKYRGSVTWLIRYDRQGESTIRESMAFRDLFLTEDALTVTNVINDIRESLPIFHREDITELGPDEMVLAMAIATVSHGVMSARRESLPLSQWHLVERDVNMTPELAAVISAYPDRTQDIVDYIGTSNLHKFNAGHLEEYLTNPARSLGSGVL